MNDTTRTSADVTVQNETSVYILHFKSSAAKEWRDKHLPANAQTWGPDGVVVEHRYVASILEGLTEDGLEVAHA